jgi:hypothetical protein
VQAGSQYHTLSYGNVAYGPCMESLYYYSGTGEVAVLEPQPCTLEIPYAPYVPLPAL